MVPIPISFSHLWGDRGIREGRPAPHTVLQTSREASLWAGKKT